jgi:hypothetical protein
MGVVVGLFNRRKPDSEPSGAAPSSASTDAFAVEKIDLVAVSPDGSTVILYIVQDGTWTDSDTELETLQAKINNYVAFAVDGQMTRTNPELLGLPWKIEVVCQTGAPHPRAQAALDRAAQLLPEYGGSLEVR